MVPIGAAQKDFVLTQEVDGTANNAMNRTADDTALEEDVVLQTLYGFSVAASSNIYAKGNFGFAPVLYQDELSGCSRCAGERVLSCDSIVRRTAVFYGSIERLYSFP